ncbi:MAG: hypothetical protein RR022_01560 [Angelakisella sp.]
MTKDKVHPNKRILWGWLLQVAGTAGAVLAGLSLAGFLLSGQLLDHWGAGAFAATVLGVTLWVAVCGKRRRKWTPVPSPAPEQPATARPLVTCACCGAPTVGEGGCCEYCGCALPAPLD